MFCFFWAVKVAATRGAARKLRARTLNGFGKYEPVRLEQSQHVGKGCGKADTPKRPQSETTPQITIYQSD